MLRAGRLDDAARWTALKAALAMGRKRASFCFWMLLFAAFLCVRRSVGLTAHALLRTTHLTGKAVMRIGKPLEHAQAAIKLSAQVPSSV